MARISYTRGYHGTAAIKRVIRECQRLGLKFAVELDGKYIEWTGGSFTARHSFPYAAILAVYVHPM